MAAINTVGVIVGYEPNEVGAEVKWLALMGKSGVKLIVTWFLAGTGEIHRNGGAWESDVAKQDQSRNHDKM